MTMLGRMSGGGVCRINEMRNVGCKGELGSILGTRGSIRQHADRAVCTNGLYDDSAEDIGLTAPWQDPAHHPQSALRPSSRRLTLVTAWVTTVATASWPPNSCVL